MALGSNRISYVCYAIFVRNDANVAWRGGGLQLDRPLQNDRFERLTLFRAQSDDEFPDRALRYDSTPGNVGDVPRQAQTPVNFNNAGH